MDKKKEYEFFNELTKDMDLIETTFKKCENPLRYLELKANYETLRIVRNKFANKFDLH